MLRQDWKESCLLDVAIFFCKMCQWWSNTLFSTALLEYCQYCLRLLSLALGFCENSLVVLSVDTSGSTQARTQKQKTQRPCGSKRKQEQQPTEIDCSSSSSFGQRRRRQVRSGPIRSGLLLVATSATIAIRPAPLKDDGRDSSAVASAFAACYGARVSVLQRLCKSFLVFSSELFDWDANHAARNLTCGRVFQNLLFCGRQHCDVDVDCLCCLLDGIVRQHVLHAAFGVVCLLSHLVLLFCCGFER